MLRKLKWQIPGEPLATRYNWCQGPVPGRSPEVKKHWFTWCPWDVRTEWCMVIGIFASKVSAANGVGMFVWHHFGNIFSERRVWNLCLLFYSVVTLSEQRSCLSLSAYPYSDWFYICKDLRKMNKYDMIYARFGSSTC